MVSLLIDGFVVTLALGAIVYMYLTNRRIAALRSAQSEVSTSVKAFVDAIGEAESAVRILKDGADDAGRKLGREIDACSKAMDEMVFIKNAMDRTATRLQRSVDEARDFLKALDEADKRTSQSARRTGAEETRGTSTVTPFPAPRRLDAEPAPEPQKRKAVQSFYSQLRRPAATA
jgi:hypothetical protein